ncbi:MAG TPA: uroporphyrinogen-III synthase, partial [Mycobacterium sp.]|nr:uroporphyrinogen-III synthase [Mycobacterium sp.]
MSQPDRAPLTGYRVAVTSARRAEELCTMLRRYGAAVEAAPAIALVDMSSDSELHHQTEALLAWPPDVLIATTATGFRAWLAAADGWGLRDALVAALSETQIVSRGPKVTGALRGAGLFEAWSSESGSSHELLHYLVEAGVAGRRVAVQLHGTTDSWDPVPELLEELGAAGADVVPIRAYRWRTAAPGGVFDQMLVRITERQFDAVAFTSAPAVVGTLLRAIKLGIADELLTALRCEVRAMCVGPVTAAPLTRLGIPTSSPPRMRLGALARHIADELPRLGGNALQAAGHRLEIRGDCVLVDGVARSLSPAGMATLRRLAQHPGFVVARADLLRVLPGNGDNTHAVET